MAVFCCVDSAWMLSALEWYHPLSGYIGLWHLESIIRAAGKHLSMLCVSLCVCVCSAHPRPVSGAVQAERLRGDEVHRPQCLPGSSCNLGDRTAHFRGPETGHAHAARQTGAVLGRQPPQEAERTTWPHLHLQSHDFLRRSGLDCLAQGERYTPYLSYKC